MSVQSLGQKDPLEKEMVTHPCVLAGKTHRKRSLVDCSPWGYTELDTTEHEASLYTWLLTIGTVLYSRALELPRCM